MNIGDIVELGSHRLMCGDAQNKDNVNELLNGVNPDLLLTDPPYGISIVNCGGGKLEVKEAQNLDLSNTHTHTHQMAQLEEQNLQASRGTVGIPARPGFHRERERVIGKVGKPRHCRTKTLQTSNR